jgi:adenine-specific DNA-methyltransferase
LAIEIRDDEEVWKRTQRKSKHVNETLEQLIQRDRRAKPPMSRLTDLIRQVQTKEPQLAADLAAEVKVLSSRRAFGLNFERHIPEVVDLPLRAVRRGDKVRVLPKRGEKATKDHRLWRVTSIERTDELKFAHLSLIDADEPDQAAVDLEDVVVVAEFRDPIYPGLKSTGRVERGGDKPFHTVINSENFHALQTLQYIHEGAVDCIYIDPPYNTRDKDWKYNNDYVDSDDSYKHSKWLAMMERRLKISKKLLNPDDSVLIVTIDEKEYLRLGMLLEQCFPEASIQMVTTVISAKGAVRPGQFSRVEEYIFFVTLGDAQLSPWFQNMLQDEASRPKSGAKLGWLGLRRREPSSIRGARPNQFYPIFVNREDGTLHSVGDAVDDDVDRDGVHVPAGAVALWPLKPDGTEMLWGLTPGALRRNWAQGYARTNNWKPRAGKGTVQYLPSGTIASIEQGLVEVSGRAPDGSIIGHYKGNIATPPKRVWNLLSHNAEVSGTKLLSALLPGRKFPYPKSLYAVEDSLRFYVKDKPEALIIDFFSGSGTTGHAVVRLNRQDGGRRRSICVTNNEVSDKEAKRFRKEGLRPGDPDWEQHGICEYITKPRLHAAITGNTSDEQSIKGNYRYTDEFPMGTGFDENIEFFDLTYETPRRVAHHRTFTAVAPLLWMKAGAQGRRIDSVDDFAVADTYGVLVDLDQTQTFIDQLSASKTTKMAFIVTNDDRRFQMVCAELPSRIAPVRLYESYLTNFEINTGRE